MENKIDKKEAALNDTAKNFFTGSVPQNYDTYMGPLLLRPYALDIVSRIKAGGPVKVLELAAGTGQVTRYLVEALPEATIMATDISEDMMAVGKQAIQSPNLVWQHVNMASIPFEDDLFDLVICQFGLMFVPDKLAAMGQIRRVLKPGGQLLFNTWGPVEENPIWHISMKLFTKTFGEALMPQAAGPFALTDTEQVLAFLAEAKFTNITAEMVYKTTQIERAEVAATGFVKTMPALKQNPGLYNQTLQALQRELAKQLGEAPLRSQLLALVFEATK